MQVYATGNNSFRVAIDAAGPAMFLFSRGTRNRLIRESLVVAGQSWVTKFLPLRPTEYVLRAPFRYPRRPAGLATIKLRTAPTLANVWTRIKAREFMGWDPWSDSSRVPRSLEEKWVREHPGDYGQSRLRRFFLGRGQVKKIRHDIRVWAKKRTREIAGNMAEDGLILPLVDSGDLRDKWLPTAYAKATATAKTARMVITMPRGDRVAERVNKMLTTLPVWEFNDIRKTFVATLNGAIANQFISQSATPRALTKQRAQSIAARKTAPVFGSRSRKVTHD